MATRPQLLRLFRGVVAAAALLVGVAVSFAETSGPSGQDGGVPESFGERCPLPVPSSLSLPEYEKQLFEFLDKRQYVQLGWLPDKRVRDTGPYLDGKSYGTHPAVRIYYSPEIIEWLQGGKQSAIPDGAMIVKEQFEAPAARYRGQTEEELLERLASWAIMVKDSRGAHDGWFWSNPAKGQQVVDCHEYPFDHPVSGYGIYCVRCHASTKTLGETNEYTFAALRNVQGFPGEPLLFNVDESWRRAKVVEEPADADTALEDPSNEAREAMLAEKGGDGVHPRCTGAASPEMCKPVLNEAFLAQFPTIGPRPRHAVEHLPPVTHDWVVRRAGKEQERQPFVTSNQCMSCHAGLVAPFGPAMFVPTGESAEYGEPGVHLSPYGEWRWTPMGLAGRDPIFFAQLESEMALMRKDFAADPQKAERLVGELVNACLTCHGVMGKRQFDLDHPGERVLFGADHVLRASNDPTATNDRHWRYGALARDGVSCAVCHHMQPREQPAGDKRSYLEFFLETSTTGNITLGKANEMYGPYEDKEIAPYAMEHALGFTPKHNPYLKSSQLCGTCHVVNLPIVDKPVEGDEGDELIAAEHNEAFRGFHHHIEQATYLEWLNSEFENEIDVENPKAKTCQDCHMSREYHNERTNVHLDRVATRIAAIQDTTYPEAENLASHQDLEVRLRSEEYSRHNFRGLNVFLLEMFNQFDDVLGVRKFDFMTGSTEDLRHAVDDFMRQARDEVATIEVEAQAQGRELAAHVRVHNKTGHRFPTGVGFRRAFLELLVVEKPAEKGASEKVVWSSGRTNELGVLVDGAGKPLPCEFFNQEPNTDKQSFQPHHDVITSPGQVQIYETLLWGAEHKFTTSFIHGSEVVKDNRLLPRGWKKNGPGPELNGAYLRATHPDAATAQDPRYGDGSGSDEIAYRIKLPSGVDPRGLTVKATLYYQAIPPYFLRSLFETAPDGPATQRLHYIASNIDLKGTPIEGWKLPVASASAEVQ